jgi:hypothetical protein
MMGATHCERGVSVGEEEEGNGGFETEGGLEARDPDVLREERSGTEFSEERRIEDLERRVEELEEQRQEPQEQPQEPEERQQEPPDSTGSAHDESDEPFGTEPE